MEDNNLKKKEAELQWTCQHETNSRSHILGVKGISITEEREWQRHSLQQMIKQSTVQLIIF